MFFGFGLQFARTGHTLALSARVARMFVNGEQGAWYDPSDMSTLFQDAAGTVPVTATGQTVGRILDISGRGNHATQTTAGSRPTFRDVGGLRYLEFDGLDDFLVTAAINFTATDKMSVFAGARKLSDAVISVLVELSALSQNNGSFCLFSTRNVGVGQYGFRSGGTITQTADTGTVFNAPRTDVFTGTGDIPADQILLRINGTQVTSSTSDQGAGNYGNHQLFIGRRGGTTMAFTGNLYGLLIRGSSTSQANIVATERFMATKSGVVIP